MKGQYTVTDLPKTGEQGFAIVQANTREEAIQLTKEFLAVAGDGECACHPLMATPPQV